MTIDGVEVTTDGFNPTVDEITRYIKYINENINKPFDELTLTALGSRVQVLALKKLNAVAGRLICSMTVRRKDFNHEN